MIRACRSVSLSLAGALWALPACRFGYELHALPNGGSADAAADDSPSDSASHPRTDSSTADPGAGDPASDAATKNPGADASTSRDAALSDAASSSNSDAGVSVTGLAPCSASDSCSCGTFGTHHYRLCPTFLNFAAAESDCEAHAMQLARIDDAAEDAWLDQAFTDVFSGLTFAFIGATDKAQEGAWRWLDGDVVFWNGDSGGSAVSGFYTHWDVNKPFGNTTRNCAGLLSNGSWEDRSCSAQNAYICEGP